MYRTLIAFCLVLVGTASLAAQSADADRVVVKIGDTEYTEKQLDTLRSSLPQQFRQNVQHMNNKAFVDTYANLLALSKASESAGLMDEEPWKSQFEFNRLNFLAQIYLSQINSTLTITPEERKQYYQDNLAAYSESNVSAIHIEYDPLPELAERAGKTPVTEQDAWAEAEKLLLDLRGGADFAALAKEHSDDKLTSDEGGVIGWLNPDSSLAPALKNAIFALKTGQISQAVKDGGKFYIFKVNETRAKPFDQVVTDILRKLQALKVQAKLEEIRATMPVEFVDGEYALQLPGK